MATVKKTRLTSIFIKEQSGDVYEDPSATDVVSRLASGVAIQATPGLITRDNLKNAYTPDADLVGVLTGGFTGVSEMYGADYSDGTTTPWFNTIFRCGQLIDTRLMEIPVSAISVDFVHNEIVTGGTGVGRVIVPSVSTDDSIIIQVTTPGFTAETITGSIAGDATATGVEVDRGVSYKFDSSANFKFSARGEEDDQFSRIFNSVPVFSITADVNGLPKLNYNLLGAIDIVDDVPQWLRDGANTEVVRDTLVPPVFNCGRFTHNDFSPIVDGTFTIDPAIVANMDVNANSCTGIDGYSVDGRVPVSSYRIGRPTNVESDVMLDWFNATDIATELRIGKDKFNTFWFFTDTAKLESVAGADENGKAKLDLGLKLTGQDDQELEIVCI